MMKTVWNFIVRNVVTFVILGVLVAIDAVAFYNMIAEAGETVWLAIMLTGMLAAAIDLVPFFWASIFLVHKTHVNSVSPKINKKNNGKEGNEDGKPDKKNSGIRVVSNWIRWLAFFSFAIPVLLIMFMRFNNISEKRQVDITGFSVTAAVYEDEDDPSKLKYEKELEINEGAGFITKSYWFFEDGLTEDSIKYGRYEGFWIDFILLFSPLITTLISIYLGFVYKNVEDYKERLMALTGEPDTRGDKGKNARNIARQIKNYERAERKELKKSHKIMLNEQKKFKKEVVKAEKDKKKAEDDLKEFKKNHWSVWEERLNIFKKELESKRAEEEKKKDFAEAEAKKEDFEKTKIMTDLWKGAGCSGDCPDDIDVFLKEFFAQIKAMRTKVITDNYFANLLTVYSGTEAYLFDCKSGMSGACANNPVVAADINDIKVNAIIDDYNQTIDPAVQLPIQQWNTKTSREALLDDFKKMMS